MVIFHTLLVVVIWYIIKPYPWILMVIMVNRLNQLYDLVGGAITILKNMSSSMGRTIPYMNWKKEKTFMFQTTNQVLSPFTVGHSLYGSLPHFSSFNLPISVGYLTPRTSLGTWLNCI